MTPPLRPLWLLRLSLNVDSAVILSQFAEAAMPEPQCPLPPTPRRWLARLGLAGFLFFLIKGLLWLIVPAVVVALAK